MIGITGPVRIGDNDITSGTWIHRPYLAGEIEEVFTVEGASRVAWQSLEDTDIISPLTWLQTK